MCHDTVHILWSMSTESQKYVKGGLPHFSPWTDGMCSVQLQDMYCYGLWNVRHCSRNVVCFQTLYYISKCCHRFMDCFHLFPIIVVNLQAQFFNFLLNAQEKITTIFTEWYHCIQLSHNSPQFCTYYLNMLCCTVLTLGSTTTSFPQYSWKKHTFKIEQKLLPVMPDIH